MREIFEQLITDFQAFELPELIRRDFELPELPSHVNKALVFMGMRRSGKTWLLYQLIEDLLKSDTEKDKILYINFEDERLSGLEASGMHQIIDIYYELFPNNTNETIHLFFDEPQEVEGWEKFIRRLIDTTKYKIYITGSSAKMLSKEISTSLRGRTLSFEVFPLAFKEYTAYNKTPLKKTLNSTEKPKTLNLQTEYSIAGGFPETLGTDAAIRDTLIQGYVNTVIYRDIVERHEIKNTAALKLFLHIVLGNITSCLSIHKIYDLIKSKGVKTSKDSLYEYLNYFEDAYCLFPVPLYSFSVKKTQTNPIKIYPIDPGIISAYTVKDPFENAARLEAIVFAELRRKGENIFYYKTKKGYEIDFIFKVKDQITLYQVCYDLASAEEREIRALIDAMKELDVNEGYVITRHETEIRKIDGCTIHVIPFWKWAQ